MTVDFVAHAAAARAAFHVAILQIIGMIDQKTTGTYIIVGLL